MKAIVNNRISDDADLPAVPRAAAAAAGAAEAKGKDLLEIAWRGRWFVLVSVIVCLSVALVYLKRATPQYTSSARIFVEQSGPKIISTMDGVAAAQGGNFLPTQLEVIKSPTVVDIAIQSGAFRDMKTFAGLDSPLGMIKAGLDVEVGRNNDIISVSFTGPYPAESADIVNRLVDAYKTYHARQKQSTAAEVMKILQQEHLTREAELQKKLQEKLQFMKENSTLVFQSDDRGSERATPANQRLSALTEALTTAQLATADARANYELVKSAQNNPARLRSLILAQSSDPQVEAQLRMQLRLQLMQLDVQLADYQSMYAPGSVVIKQLQAREAQLKQQMASLGASSVSENSEPDPKLGLVYLATAEQKLAVAEMKQKQLELALSTSLQQQQREVVDANNKAAQFATMDSDYRRLEKLCDDLQTRMNEIHVTEDTGALNVTVLEWGKPPGAPSKPDRTRTLMIALLLGITLGFGMAFVIASTDHRFRSAEEVQSALDLPVLGAVPLISGVSTLPERGKQVELQPTSDVAEAYRTIRTAVYFGLADTQQKTLLITSPQPGDGKSTSASNLAIAMAKAGRRTLLVDADFRRPSLHKIYNLGPSIGFAGVLQGKGPIADAIQPTGITNLDLLPCGPVPDNPAELLNSEHFAEVLKGLSEQYIHVVIDSSPVLPVTDARILAAVCDSTLLVLRAEKSTRRTARFARDMLQSTGASLAGVLVNGASKRSGGYGYGYGYGYYYGYRYGGPSNSGNGNGSGDANANGNAAPVHVLKVHSTPLLDMNIDAMFEDPPPK